MKVLVIAPHPDDEVLGCGGVIKKHEIAGDTVFLCVVTTVYEPEWEKEFVKNRHKEVEKAGKILGIKKIYFLDYKTVHLDIISQKELNDSFTEIINKIEPDILYIPSKSDLNMDHRVVFESALVAARPISTSIKRILSYETLSETEWGKGIDQFIPTVFVDISKTFSAKIEAMKIYESEIKKYPHPRSLKGIEVLAEKRGSEVCIEKCEAFELIREIIKE